MYDFYLLRKYREDAFHMDDITAERCRSRPLVRHKSAKGTHAKKHTVGKMKKASRRRNRQK